MQVSVLSAASDGAVPSDFSGLRVQQIMKCTLKQGGIGSHPKSVVAQNDSGSANADVSMPVILRERSDRRIWEGGIGERSEVLD